MIGPFSFTVLGLLGFVVFRVYSGLRRNIELAKRSGLPYITSPFVTVGYDWILVASVTVPILRKLPFTSSWQWLSVIDPDESWSHLRAADDKYGDTYIMASPFLCYLKTTDAQIVAQITSRRDDFRKPVENYKIVDLFGTSILTTETGEWRRHRKVVGPSFSEKSNKLVFEESLAQAEGMMAFWSSQVKNTAKDVRVENTAIDTAVLSLHVICAAGFGVPQLWPGESEEKLAGQSLPGFSSLKPTGSHTHTFKESLNQLLASLMWLLVFPASVLKYSPFQIHKKASTAFNECKIYFDEILEAKKQQLYLGESAEGTMDLMGPMIKAAGETVSSENSKTSNLGTAIFSRDEVIGNSFIFLFAGHETTANSLHFSFIELAISLPTQKRLQADIDSIVGPDKPISEFSYYTDMPRLYNSMVGAVLNEQLRLIPPVINLPKVTVGDQRILIDGKEHLISDKVFIHLNVVGTNRNPRYWPHSPSKISGKEHDMDDFVPERWLHAKSNATNEKPQVEGKQDYEAVAGLESVSFETSTASSLYKPVKGSFVSFSEGARACPGRRFAQVEITAILTVIFQKYTVEFDVGEWASDDEVDQMGPDEKKALYEKAITKARKVLRNCTPHITLQMKPGDKVPLRFVKRGTERFAGLY